MHKFNRLIISILAISTFSVAGKNVVPTETAVVVPTPVSPVIIEEGSFYLGLAYSLMSMKNDLSDEEFSANAVMIQAGYQYNSYLAVEGRYTHNIGDIDYTRGSTFNRNNNDYPADFTNLAIYLKPIYTINNFSMYALLGYGEVELTNIPQLGELSADRAENGFQWGLGVNYLFNEKMSIFVDYVNMYDDKGFDYRAQYADIKVEAWTLGVSYKF